MSFYIKAVNFITRKRLLYFMGGKLYRLKNGIRAFRSWVVPVFKSFYYRDQFRPILSYLFTEWKCNIDCHYCFDFDNKRKGMTLETAKKSIDWLKKYGCRVIAIMGGEPLLRKEFILKVIEYGKKQGFFVYLPTNGYLMDKDFIDKAGKAGVAAVNVAIDCIEPKPGLPKALVLIEKNVEYLLKQREKYGYVVFFNINITSKNMDDVKKLTEFARANDIATDYHINEMPQIEKLYFKHHNHDLCVGPDKYKEADELLDWLIEKNKQGYNMINPRQHLVEMKDFIKHKHRKWYCNAGKNGLFIGADGRLSPCFGLMNSGYDWGTVGNKKFHKKKLAEMKKECYKGCFSTCFWTLGYYCDIKTIYYWWRKHVVVGSSR